MVAAHIRLEPDPMCGVCSLQAWDTRSRDQGGIMPRRAAASSALCGLSAQLSSSADEHEEIMDWVDMWPAIWAFLLGVSGWALVSFLGKPWLDFRDLKRRVHIEIIYTWNIGGEVPDEVDYNKDAFNEAVGSLRRLAAEVYAAKANAVPALAWLLETWWGYNLIKAGAGLIALSSSLEKADGSRALHRKSIEEALKLPPLL
jgi:hypothetical protein